MFAQSTSSSSIPMFMFLGISQLRPTAPIYQRVVWKPPDYPWIKFNTDGSFRGPDRAGYGGIARDHDGLFLHAFAGRAQVLSALDAEVLAFLEAIRIAVSRG